MKKKTIKKTFLLIVLVLLLIGIVSATDTNKTDANTIEKITEDNTNTITENTNQYDDTQNTQITKKINKTHEDNAKTSGTKIVFVKSSSSLIKELTETKTTSTTKIINLKKGTYNITTSILLKNQKYTKIIINGNNSNIVGTYNKQFLNITSKYDVTLKKLNIKNFKTSNAIYNVETSNVKGNNTGAIANYGKLTIKNCTFQNNQYSFTELNKDAYPPITDHKNLNEKYPAGAGAIYNKGTMAIVKSNFKNNRGYDAGAIYNKGIMTIKTSTFTNNHAEAGAICNKGTLKIDGCAFISNSCDDEGLAAAIRNENKLKVTNSNFKKNKGYFTGGIYNFEELTVKNTTFEGNTGYTSAISTNKKAYIHGTFKNNKAEDNIISNYGDGTTIIGNFINNYVLYTSTIFNLAQNVKVIGNFINNTNVKQSGGAIYNCAGTMGVQGTFKNNKAVNGGAIANFDTMTIQKSKFVNNKATKMGGAIYMDDYYTNPTTKIYANFTDNTATRGGAIFIGSNCKTIKINSNFTKNHATYGGAIYNNGTQATITGNFNYNYASNKYNFVCNKGTNNKISATPTKYTYSKYGGAIYNKANNTTINIKSTQKTEIEQLQTKITINNIAKLYQGNYATITGKLADETGNILKNTTLTININGKTYTTKTDNNGKYTYKYKTTTTGTNNLTISYAGNTNYIKTSTQKTFTVTGPKNITVYTFYTSEAGMSHYEGDDNIYSYFETEYESQTGPGVWVEIRNRYAERLDDLAPTHRILSAKFVFANDYNGNTITKTVTPQYYDYASTSLISGYHPTKVILTIREMTDYETQQWYKQFEY